MSLKNNIVLIGFMGSGKSSVGRELSKQIDKFFLDTDTLIEDYSGKSIGNIFKEDGEKSFRAIEQNVSNWLVSSVNNVVLSTGGGMPMSVDNLKDIGKVIYLQISFEDILMRMDSKEIDKRPLFKDVSQAKERYDSRISVYESMADIIVDASLPIDKVIENILKKL